MDVSLSQGPSSYSFLFNEIYKFMDIPCRLPIWYSMSASKSIYHDVSFYLVFRVSFIIWSVISVSTLISSSSSYYPGPGVIASIVLAVVTLVCAVVAVCWYRRRRLLLVRTVRYVNPVTVPGNHVVSYGNTASPQVFTTQTTVQTQAPAYIQSKTCG